MWTHATDFERQALLRQKAEIERSLTKNKLRVERLERGLLLVETLINEAPGSPVYAAADARYNEWSTNMKHLLDC